MPGGLSTDEEAQPMNPVDKIPTVHETITPAAYSTEASSTPALKPDHSPVPKLSSNISTEMHQIRIDFTKALGLDWSENPNPNSGYKYEHNLTRRQQYLDDARRLRDLYAGMVDKAGRGRGILEKMDSNLENRDRKTLW